MQDYQGELQVILENRGSYVYTVKAGHRIAQLMILPCFMGELAVTESDDAEDPPTTSRGSSGFGSTGL